MAEGIEIGLRHSEAEYLLKVLTLVPDSQQSNIIHTDLVRRLTAIRDVWANRAKLALVPAKPPTKR